MAIATGPCCCLCFHPLRPTPTLALALGACIESHTEVGGVFVRWRESTTPAVGVAERLGYIVLARESGRGGEEAVVADVEVRAEAAVLAFVAQGAVLLLLTCSCSWATRASSAAA
jgi:hypothetical protein